MDQSVSLWYVMTEWGLDFWLPALLAAAAAYFCGCFNGAVIVSKYILRDDVRSHGSGNAGLTNFYRTFGGPLTLVVILTDMLKMVAAVAVGVLLMRTIPNGGIFAKYWAGLFCLLGHVFPCMFGFKGGKGILSGWTLALLVDWRAGLVMFAAFLLCVLLTRYVSLGSCVAAASFPVASWFINPYWETLLLAAVSSALALWMHRGNIHRLLTGTENKLHKKN
ncbi:MAG: glycerol-3-phosphate acyltransferase [Oscillospiraceae bacterium]|nr:glycerol-3-phosphate acyltransferase [Oscillospiraceae bacterium]